MGETFACYVSYVTAESIIQQRTYLEEETSVPVNNDQYVHDENQYSKLKVDTRNVMM